VISFVSPANQTQFTKRTEVHQRCRIRARYLDAEDWVIPRRRVFGIERYSAVRFCSYFWFANFDFHLLLHSVCELATDSLGLYTSPSRLWSLNHAIFSRCSSKEKYVASRKRFAKEAVWCSRFAERFDSVEWGESSTTDICSRRTSESCSGVRNTSGFGMVNCWSGVVFIGVLVQVDTGVRLSSSRVRIRDKWWKLDWNGKRVGLLSLRKRYIGVISFPLLTEVSSEEILSISTINLESNSETHHSSVPKTS